MTGAFAENLDYHPAEDIGETEVAASEMVSEAFVVETREVKHGRVKVMNTHGIFATRYPISSGSWQRKHQSARMERRSLSGSSFLGRTPWTKCARLLVQKKHAPGAGELRRGAMVVMRRLKERTMQRFYGLSTLIFYLENEIGQN